MPDRREARRGRVADTRDTSEEVAPNDRVDEAPYGQPRRGDLSAAMAGKAGLRHIADLTAKETEGITRVQPAEHGWVVEVEVVEDRRIPSSGDILALYEAEMDMEGNLLAYRRIRRYRRGRGDYGEAS